MLDICMRLVCHMCVSSHLFSSAGNSSYVWECRKSIRIYIYEDQCWSHTWTSFKFECYVAFLWWSLATSMFALIWRWLFHLGGGGPSLSIATFSMDILVVHTSRAALARRWAGSRLILWLAARRLICRGSDWKVSEVIALLCFLSSVGIIDDGFSMCMCVLCIT